MRKEPLKICHVVSYRDPAYIRTRNLRVALNLIRHCEVYDATNKRPGWLRYFETIWKTLKVRLQHNPDVYVLGFRGHEIFWFIRLIAIGKRLVFDEFMSPSDALLSEKKAEIAGRILGYVALPLEWLCLHFSGRCLTDTQLHKDFIAARFRVPLDKIDVVYVGAVPADNLPTRESGTANSDDSSPLSVLFYGTFLPLHGMDVILQACKLLEGRPIEIRIIGGRGNSLARFLELLDKLQPGNVTHDLWVDFDDLQSTIIPNADLCLGGPFGGTPQARRVITGKTFQFLAQSKPTVIGRVDEPVEFVDRENCLLVDQASPESLAKTFEWAISNRAQLPDIGKNGNRLFSEHFSAAALAAQLEPALRTEI
jgi:glycosyltransferase involved in cell wall biosynthesis